MDHLLQETKRIRPLTNQVAYNTFTVAHGRGQYALPTGPKVIYNVESFFPEILEVCLVTKVMTNVSRSTVIERTGLAIRMTYRNVGLLKTFLF